MAHNDPCAPDYADAIAKARAEFLASRPAKEEQQEQPEPAVAPYPLLSVKEFCAIPQQHDIVKGMLPSVGVGYAFGASTAAKTFFIIDLAVHVCRGQAWRNLSTKQTPVCLFFLEGISGGARRLQAYETFHGIKIPENFKIGIQPTTFYKDEDIQALRAAIPMNSLVIVDTQSRVAAELDENSARDMNLFIEQCYRIAIDRQCCICLIHHTGKNSDRGIRGASSQFANADFCIEVSRSGQHRKATVRKSKDGGLEGAEFPFRLAVVDLGPDEDNDRITSCVALPDGEAVQEEKPLTPALNYALESLRAALEKADSKSVHVDDWRPTFYAGHTADNDNAKKVAFHRDRNKLVTLGKICVENNRYSFADHIGTSQQRHNTVTSDAPVTSQHVTHLYNRCDDVTQCDGEERRG
ncbi:MAG: AAA family ATPase [Clostridia bacterium]|nr:AAA family ATPase [Clostridia bacterium]